MQVNNLLFLTLGIFVTAGNFIARPNDAENPAVAAYLSPQNEVDVGEGRKVNVICTGHGSPTVLLNAGLGDSASTWWRIQPEVAKLTRVCSFDRAGYGFSSPIPGGATADVDAAAKDMWRVIDKLDLGPKVVLVGHSLGGMFDLRAAFERPGSVAAMLLLDPSFSGQPAGPNDALQEASVTKCYELALHGRLAVDASDPNGCLSVNTLDDPRLTQLRREQLTRRQTYEAILSELDNLRIRDKDGKSLDEREMDAARVSLGNIPLVIISRLGSSTSDNKHSKQNAMTAVFEARLEGQRQLVSLSQSGKQIVLLGISHYIQRDRPQAVIQEIRQLVLEYRARLKINRGRLK